MNRKEKIAFVNEKILPHVRFDDKGAGIEALKLLSRWRIGKNADIKMDAKVIDGFLFINDEPVGRIAAKSPRQVVSDCACYWEGRILERQDADY